MQVCLVYDDEYKTCSSDEHLFKIKLLADEARVKGGCGFKSVLAENYAKLKLMSDPTPPPPPRVKRMALIYNQPGISS